VGNTNLSLEGRAVLVQGSGGEAGGVSGPSGISLALELLNSVVLG
jgi:hypothetical protein